MIKSKEELYNYLSSDRKALDMKYPFFASLTFGEHARIRSYLTTLRYTEYYSQKTGLFGKILYGINFLNLRRKSLKYGMYISPHSVGKGLNLPHPGFILISSIVKMGNDCTVLPMVLFGKAHPESHASITVGDNCYFGVGSSVIGDSIRIGNNVTVAAGAVVTKEKKF